jgi:hypothetical protein
MYKAIHRLFIAIAAVSLFAVAGAAPASAEKSCACVRCTWAKGRVEMFFPTAKEAQENESNADLEAAHELTDAQNAKGPPVCKAGCQLTYSKASHGPPYSGGGGQYPNIYSARSPWSIIYTCMKIVPPDKKADVKPGGNQQPLKNAVKSRKAGVSEDNPNYMENYTPPAKTKTNTTKKTGDSGYGPPPSDDKTDDKKDDKPSNDTQPEIPVPH